MTYHPKCTQCNERNPCPPEDEHWRRSLGIAPPPEYPLCEDCWDELEQDLAEYEQWIEDIRSRDRTF